MFVERRKILSTYGAQVILTEVDRGMEGAIAKAKELSLEKGYVMADQFDNPYNPIAHEKSTVLEILENFEYLDAFVAGVGTGGTLTGVGRILKKKMEGIRLVVVEPENSAVISGEEKGKHGIQGIGAGFIPGNLEVSLLTQIQKVSDQEAFSMAKNLAVKEGLFVGISSGAAVVAAIRIADCLGEDSKILAIAPDGGDRYFSVDKLF